MIVDAHHHLWNYARDEYSWIDDKMQVIARDFSAEDLQREAVPMGVKGTVAVQARQTLEETQWLLELADRHEYLLGVVGWAPLSADSLSRVLDDFAPFAKLKGLRHVVQDELDDDFILREDFNRGVRTAIQRDYAYDILVFERHLPQTIEFARRHPSGRLVLDHIAKPLVADDLLEPWSQNLRKLAQCDNVTCKISGVVTEAKWDDWSLESIRPYLDTALEAFGPRRLMFGSDWPVCLLASTYRHWVEVVTDWAAPLSEDERTRLFGKTAIETYRLSEVNE